MDADDRLVWAPRVPRPAPAATAGAVRAPASPFGGPIETLQRSIGNRAVQRLLALQREPTAEQKKEFAGYIAEGDWGRAAWVLNEWDPADIAARIRTMSSDNLESLNEGAWHGGKGKVDAAVRARNPTAATMGALRVLIWGKRWDEAAKQLDTLDRKAALTYVRGLADKGKITGDELRGLMKIAQSLRLQAGDTMKIGDQFFAVYDTTVRFSGGDVVWLYNNPGALKRPSPDISSWGYIGSDSRGFLVFPDMATGQKAAVANLQFQAKANGDRSILETMASYASMPTDKPDVYADKIVNALGGPPKFTRATKFGSLNQKQLDIVKETIFSTEVGATGEEVAWDSTKLPQEVRDRLRK
jgi:hypothetical protein